MNSGSSIMSIRSTPLDAVSPFLARSAPGPCGWAQVCFTATRNKVGSHPTLLAGSSGEAIKTEHCVSLLQHTFPAQRAESITGIKVLVMFGDYKALGLENA